MRSYIKLKVENLKDYEIEGCVKHTSDVSYCRIEIKQVNDHTTWIVILSSYSKEFLEDATQTFIRSCNLYQLSTDVKISIIEQYRRRESKLSQGDSTSKTHSKTHIKWCLPSIKDILDVIKCIGYITIPIVALVGICFFVNSSAYKDFKKYACSMMLSDSEKIAAEYDRLVAE